MATYIYTYDGNKYHYQGYVKDINGNSIWEAHYPEFIEDEKSGEVMETSNIFDEGVHNPEDIEGVENYLKSIGVLNQNDELVDESGYMGEGEEYEEEQEMSDDVELEKENLEMLQNQIVQIKHHAEEIADINNVEIEPWVITKGQRAATDLSDITHYLDGKKAQQKMGYGGAIEKEFQVEFTWGDADDESRSVYIKADTKEEAEDKAKQKFGKAYEGFKIIKIERSMKTGGKIETQSKNKLKATFELPLELVVYVPSTTTADRKISDEEFEHRIDYVETYLSDLFGGYSATEVEGGYVSDEKGLIQEDVMKVTAFGQVDNFEDKFNQLLHQVKMWCEEWGQESIGFEFEGDLFYINKDSKFKDGGYMAKGGVTIGDLNSMIREYNEDGRSFELRGAYGYFELWSKGNRLEVGSKKDIYNALVKYRFNEKYADGGATDDNILKLYKGYAEAVLFSENDSDTQESLDSNYSISDFDKETVKSSKDMLRKFYNENKDAIDESGLDLETIGNDVWYTRAGHGAGFFDHNLDEEVEDKLTKGAKKLGEYPSIETYNGKISIRGGRVFADGGYMANGGGFNQYGEPYGFDRDEYYDMISEYDRLCAFYEDAESDSERARLNVKIDALEDKINAYERMEDGGETDEYAKGGNIPSIERRVAEVNAMIEDANEKGLEVVDEGQTWQAPMKYKPIKYTRGVLYISYEQLDLYKYNKGLGVVWEKKNDIVGKNVIMYSQSQALSEIARMYRKVLNHYDKYGYKDGGVTFDEKVSSISKSLLKRKKVSPSVQKDYGKTYNKKEAIDSAKRIAGKIRAKEISKKKD